MSLADEHARAVAETVSLRRALDAACSERDALAAQRDQLISRLNLEKGAATLLLAERDRLASQCAALRTALARIACGGNAEVAMPFDEPRSARIASEALALLGAPRTEPPTP